MEGPGAPGVPWKRHIVRQLRQRDRTQKALFLELVPAYNRLLEKAELLARISEKLQPEPNDATPATHQGPWEEESEPDSDQVPSPTTLRMKWQEEEEGLRLVCGEMAYQVVEKRAALGALESTLEERQSRLAALEARVAQLQEARAQQTRHLDVQRALNVAQRAAYEGLRAQAGLQEAALRRHEEEARDLLEWLVQRKARAAAERNLRNERHERAKQARMSLELKKAAKRTVSISESPKTVGDGIREMAETVTLAAEPLSLETEAGEKWKRPFRSASATSLTLSRCVDVVKGLLDFKKRRGHSVGGAPEQRYQSIPVCVAVQPPTQVQDVLVVWRPTRPLKELVAASPAWTLTLRGPCCTQVIPVQGRVTSLNLSHDQLHLLSCSRDNTLKVIDLRVSNIRQVFRADGFKCGSDWTKAVFSPDRSYALAGSWDGALYVWDVDTGKLEGSLRGPHCIQVAERSLGWWLQDTCAWLPFLLLHRAGAEPVWPQCCSCLRRRHEERLRGDKGQWLLEPWKFHPWSRLVQRPSQYLGSSCFRRVD
ncbi:protein Atg16l2 isoform X6 [Panthera leo]|uniref:protein Atg16l2 isoform X6 n=1 Tax=Panthera leo TaxID=9689 RepID=UPI001C6A0D21|nr:protein Atg16l2 isoform X6 [Panthera leo]